MCTPWFGASLAKLPKPLQAVVESSYYPLVWDGLTPQERSDYASRFDHANNPDFDLLRVTLWDEGAQRLSILAEMRSLYTLERRTALDLEAFKRLEKDFIDQLAKLDLVEGTMLERSGLGQLDGQRYHCKPVIKHEIILNFKVYPDPNRNAEWWSSRMSDAKKYGLVACRVGAGKRGPGGHTLWQPEAVAAWLFDRVTKGLGAGMSKRNVIAALKKFDGGADAVAELFSPDMDEEP